VNDALARQVEHNVMNEPNGGQVGDKPGWELLQPEDFEPAGSTTGQPPTAHTETERPPAESINSPGGDAAMDGDLFGDTPPREGSMDCDALEDVTCIMIFESIGSNTKSYRRERRRGFR